MRRNWQPATKALSDLAAKFDLMSLHLSRPSISFDQQSHSLWFVKLKFGAGRQQYHRKRDDQVLWHDESAELSGSTNLRETVQNCPEQRCAKSQVFHSIDFGWVDAKFPRFDESCPNSHDLQKHLKVTSDNHHQKTRRRISRKQWGQL